MRGKKKYIKFLSIIVFILSIGSISWIVYGNDEKDITYSIQEELLEEGTKAKLILEVVPSDRVAEISSITLPDGSVVEKQSNITYEVIENEEYKFIVQYKILEENGNQEVLESIKEEVITYQEESIQAKVEEKKIETLIIEDNSKEKKDGISNSSRVYAGISITEETFPDDNFRNWLLNSNNINGCGADRTLYESEIATITSIEIPYKGITDLRGIEYFTALTTLECYGNQLTSLDVNKNSNLKYLSCWDNKITDLDISRNSLLTELYCQNNQLRSLETNSALTNLYCYKNQLSSLNISNCLKLEELKCNNNQLQSLNVSNNKALKVLFCYSNELTILELSNNIALTNLQVHTNELKNLDVSKNTELSILSCYENNLTNLNLSNHSKISIFSGGKQIIEIPMISSGLEWKSNPNIKYTMTSLGNSNCRYNSTTGQITVSNNSVTSSTFNTNCIDGLGNIQKIEGTINFIYDGVLINDINFPNLNFRNWLLSNDNISGFGSDGLLTSTELAGITTINVNAQNIGNLKGIEHFTSLKTLQCNNNNLENLDVSKNTLLETLECYVNQLSTLDVSQNKNLKTLYCRTNKLESLDVSNNTLLMNLACASNKITSLDIANNTSLVSLSCNDNQLAKLNISNNLQLNHLNCANNKIQELDVSQNINLETLACYRNHLMTLNLTNNKKINSYIADNQTINVTMTFSNHLWQSDTSYKYVFTSLNDNNFTYDKTTGQISIANKEHPSSGFNTTFQDGNGITRGITGTLHFIYDGIEINETNFPDENFRNWILDSKNIYGYGADGGLSSAEIAKIKNITINNMGIESLKGIEHFMSLTNLYCSDNQLKELDISKNTALTDFECIRAGLNKLDVSKNTLLRSLNCKNNKLTELNISNNPSLVYLYCDNNQLTTLDASKQSKLVVLSCANNDLTKVDVTNQKELLNFQCGYNQITELDISKNIKLVILYCQNNQITNLDLSNNTMINNFMANAQHREIQMLFNDNLWKSNATIKYELGSIENTNMTYDNAIGQFSSENAVTKSDNFTTDCVDGNGTYRQVSGTLNFNYEGFTPVTSIKDTPKSIQIGKKMTLSGKIEPSTATEKNISWTIKEVGSTGATLEGNNLLVNGGGTVIITATVLGGKENGDYTQDFAIITYTSPSVLVSIPKEITLERVLHDNTFEAIKQECVSILDTTDTNVFSNNFYIKTAPSFYLINKADADEYFTAQIYDENNTKHTSKETPIAILNSTIKSKGFFIKAYKDVFRKNGIYEGTMNFEIGYGEVQ